MKGYQLKITIKGSKPPIWRRVMVPEWLTFCQLHQAIRGALGWYDYHLHRFESKKPGLFIRETWKEDDLAEPCGCNVLEEGIQIGTLIVENLRFMYTYDFGDTWRHQILMEKEVEYEYSYSQVLRYKGDNVPENCDGIGGYYNLSDKPDDPGAEGHNLMEEWAYRRGMGEYDLDGANANLKTHPAFGQGRAENSQEDAVRELAVQEHAASKQKAGIQNAEKSEIQKPDLRVIHILEELFSRFDEIELPRITKVHRTGRCNELGKSKLAPASTTALLGSRHMGRFFGILGDGTIAKLEKAAAAGNIGYQRDLEALSFLHYDGYCGSTSLGITVVPADVVKAYDEINIGKFQPNHRYRGQVWAYCKVAVYLYGVVDVGRVGTICKAVSCGADAEEITRLCREMKGVWTDFAYWDSRFIDWDLIQADAYKDISNYQKSKEFYIPSAPQVKEIVRTGAVELERRIRPLKVFFPAMVGCDEKTVWEATSSIHHHVRLGTTPETVEDIVGHFGLNLDSQEKMDGFDEIMGQVWKETRTVGNCGHNRAGLDAKTVCVDPGVPCLCDSGERCRQCCDRK